MCFQTLKFEVEGTHHDNAASRRDNQGGHGTRAVFHSDDVTTGGSPVDSHMRALWPESSQTHFLRAATAFIADAGAYVRRLTRPIKVEGILPHDQSSTHWHRRCSVCLRTSRPSFRHRGIRSPTHSRGEARSSSRRHLRTRPRGPVRFLLPRQRRRTISRFYLGSTAKTCTDPFAYK